MLAISAQNINKNFGNFQALKDINLSIHRGTILGVIGRSGAGKSTLFRCLLQLDVMDSGHLEILGENFRRLEGKEQRLMARKIGVVFQNFNLLSRRTVEENIRLPLEITGVESSEMQERVHQLVELVGLKKQIHQYPHQLSGGQCQRVAIARALASKEVELLLCDEFTSALDPETTLEILALLRELKEKLKLTILLITHDMQVVREICEEVVVMEQGRIVEAGAIEKILLHPQHGVTRSLLQKSTNEQLPGFLKEKLHLEPEANSKQVFLKLFFGPQSSQRPIISELTRTLGENEAVNIILAQLDHLRGEKAFGHLLVSMPYREELLVKVKNFLKEQDVQVDVLGYGDSDV